MNKHFVTILATTLLFGTASAQTSAQTEMSGSASQNTSATANQSGAQANSSTSANAGQNADIANGGRTQSAASQLQSGSTVQAQLTKPVDARKNKAGDEVVAKTTQDVKSNGHVVLPKGSKIMGHVTEAKARAKGQSDSSVGLAFDHAVLKDGTTVPVSFAVQAIGNSSAAAQAAQADADTTMATAANTGMSTSTAARSTGGGLVGGVGATAGGVTNTATGVGGGTLSGAGNVGGGISAPLPPASRGMVGMPNLNLVSATSNSSTITSSTSNVHLDSGTEMILRSGDLRANQ